MAPSHLPRPISIIFISPLSIVAGEAGVRLDAAADQHVVGLEGEAVEMDREAFGRAGRRRPSPSWSGSGSRRILGDAVGFHHLPLALGGAAAVAAHGRNDEGPAPQPLEMLDDRAKDDGDIGDAAAAGGDGHGLARPDPLQLQPGKLGWTSAGTSAIRRLSKRWRTRKISGVGHHRQCSDAGFPVIIGHGNKERKALPTDTVAGTS